MDEYNLENSIQSLMNWIVTLIKMMNGDVIENQCLTKDNLVKVVEKNKSEINGNLPNFKVYKKRWLMLALFIISCGTNNLQFVQYSIISNIISR